MRNDLTVEEMREKASALSREADLLELLGEARRQLGAWEASVRPLLDATAPGFGNYKLLTMIDRVLGDAK